MLVLVARNASVAKFGIFATVLAVMLFASVATELGTDTHCSRLLAKGRREFAEVTAFTHLCLTAGATVVGTTALAIGSLNFPLLSATVLVPLYVLSERQLNFRLNNLIALDRAVRGIVPLISARFLSLLALLLALVQYDASRASPFVLFCLISGLSNTLAVVLLVRRGGLRIRVSGLREVRDVIRHSRAYWIATLSGQMRTLDVAIVALIASPAAAAVYALPARAVAPLRLLGTSLGAVAFPMASRSETTSLHRLNRATSGLALLATPAARSARCSPEISLGSITWSVAPTDSAKSWTFGL